MLLLLYNTLMPTLATNNKARFDYNILETLDAGLVLEGREVKSVRSGNISMAAAYITVGQRGASLVNCHIGPYAYAPNHDYDPTHSRRVLLKQSEINTLLGKEKGLTIVPLEIYANQRGFIKLKIGLGRGRKKQDKREYLKKRETEKEIRSYT